MWSGGTDIFVNLEVTGAGLFLWEKAASVRLVLISMFLLTLTLTF